MILFPISTGITTECFKDNSKVIYYNQWTPLSDHNWSKDVDNIQSIKEIENITFLALTRNNGTSNGILQLFNKKTPILAQDLRKINAIKRFFGGCIENIEDITKKLTTTLAV